MLKIGENNKLKVNRLVNFGAYLDGGASGEILMPAKYIISPLQPGDEVDVFVYTDSEDRLVATTERPFAHVGEFAFLQVLQVNRVGAFLDWGLAAKNLLVPFSEQKARMHPGGIYLVYVYLDHTTKRVVASSKIEKYIGNVVPRYEVGDKVRALIYQHTPIGYKCIVDNLHYGMIYDNEVFRPIEVENTVDAYVRQVRDDGKIDLTLGERASVRTDTLSDRIYEAAVAEGGRLPMSDKSSPDEIRERFQCSKRDFKQAVGHLFRDRRILLGEGEIVVANK